MSHPLLMSLSVTSWGVDPELLDGMSIELVHSELFGDALRIKLGFKDGHGVLIEGDLKDGQGRAVYDELQKEIGRRS